MTSKEISMVSDYLRYNHSPGEFEIYTRRVQWEIALQFALLNEHNARMEERYMQLTATAVKKSGARSHKSEVRSRKGKR